MVDELKKQDSVLVQWVGWVRCVAVGHFVSSLSLQLHAGAIGTCLRGLLGGVLRLTVARQPWQSPSSCRISLHGLSQL